MHILVLGNGAREHALAWKLLQSKRVTELSFCPPHPAAYEQLQNLYCHKKISNISLPLKTESDLKILAQKSQQLNIAFVVVGPDNLLALGAVDIFKEHGINTFGPTKMAARIESSKSFAKKIMNLAGVPTASYLSTESVEEAQSWIQKWDFNQKSKLVIKADGLALGKGVIIVSSKTEALEALHTLRKISTTIILEEFLSGYELSAFALCDGQDFRLLPFSQDYKKITSHPESANTGGMGSYTPVHVQSELKEQISQLIFKPILQEMQKQGCPFTGLLYAGLMVHDNQVWVLEFNARFGDPETQSLLPHLNVDLLDWLEACAEQKLKNFPLSVPTDDNHYVYVVAASEGYPENPITQRPIEGFELWLQEHRGFFAGIYKNGSQWLTQGGRVLGALGCDRNLTEAQKSAYKNLTSIYFLNMQYRTDIAELSKIKNL